MDRAPLACSGVAGADAGGPARSLVQRPERPCDTTLTPARKLRSRPLTSGAAPSREEHPSTALHPSTTQRYANVGDDIDPAGLHVRKLVAHGRTNIAIAHQVGASPRAIGQRVRGVQRDLNSPRRSLPSSALCAPASSRVAPRTKLAPAQYVAAQHRPEPVVSSLERGHVRRCLTRPERPHGPRDTPTKFPRCAARQVAPTYARLQTPATAASPRSSCHAIRGSQELRHSGRVAGRWTRRLRVSTVPRSGDRLLTEDPSADGAHLLRCRRRCVRRPGSTGCRFSSVRARLGLAARPATVGCTVPPVGGVCPQCVRTSQRFNQSVGADD